MRSNQLFKPLDYVTWIDGLKVVENTAENVLL